MIHVIVRWVDEEKNIFIEKENEKIKRKRFRFGKDQKKKCDEPENCTGNVGN